MSEVLFTKKPIAGCCCAASKKITGIDLMNPWIATALVAVGTYYIAKKAKLI
jgi:hypothetical protein